MAGLRYHLGQETAAEAPWVEPAMPEATPTGGGASIFSTITRGISDILTSITSPTTVKQVMDRVIFGQPSGVAPGVTVYPAPGAPSTIAGLPAWVVLLGGAAVLYLAVGGKKKGR